MPAIVPYLQQELLSTDSKAGYSYQTHL